MSRPTPPGWAVRVFLRARHVLGRSYRGSVPATARLLEGSFGLIETKALWTAAELQIADALAAGPLTTDALAARVDGNADALGRLLRLLVVVRLLRARGTRSVAQQRDVGAAARRPPRVHARVGAVLREQLGRPDLGRAPELRSHRRLRDGGRVRPRVLRPHARTSRDRRDVRRRNGRGVALHRTVRLRGIRLRCSDAGLRRRGRDRHAAGRDPGREPGVARGGVRPSRGRHRGGRRAGGAWGQRPLRGGRRRLLRRRAEGQRPLRAAVDRARLGR